MLLLPLKAFGAEVLQIRNSSLLQIGDSNRNYSVRLACLNVDLPNEVAAKEFLKLKLPRKSRVNLRPKGSSEGILEASVIPLGSDKDLTEIIVESGLGNFSC